MRPKTRKKIENQRIERENIINKKLSMRTVHPMTANQGKFFRDWDKNEILAATGTAGTGKTFCSLYLGLKDVFLHSCYDRIIILRSAVQGRNQGFLPGSKEEKEENFEENYFTIVNDLMGRKDAYAVLKQAGQIEFRTTSFLRGLTFDNAIIIVDECQNMDYEELSTIITRVGVNSKIVFCGDTKQDDLARSKNRNDVSGMAKFMDVLDRISGHGYANTTFDYRDILRSGIVKKFIMAEEGISLDRFEEPDLAA
jgi:phosphate starvation-inducible protein PhoH